MPQIPFPVYLLLPSGVFIFLIGFYSWNKTKKKESLLFFIYSIILACWAVGGFLLAKSCGNNRMTILVDRLLIYLPSLFGPPIIYHFSIEFCKAKKNFLLYLYYIIALIYVPLSQTDYFVNDVFYYQWGCHTKAQILHHFFPLIYISSFILSGYNFFKIWKNPKESFLKKSQSFYVLLAFLCFGLVAPEFLPAYGIGVYPIFYLGLPLFTVIIAYAITEKQLFAEVVATDILVLAILIFLATLLIFPSLEMAFFGRLVIFLLILFLSYLLLKHTHQEAKRRAEAEELATKERILRERAEGLAREFERLDRIKTQFILATQHHIRTPLSIMKGYTSMLLEGSYGKIQEKAKKPLLGIEESIERLVKLVNEFLDISQLQAGKEILKEEEVDMNKLIEEIIEELKPEAEKKNLYLKFEKEEKELPKIKLDRTKIKSALFNIVDNGIKYTKKGGVIIRLKAKDEKLKIEVSDTGIGLTPVEIEHLFRQLFERGKEAEKAYTTGRGIGLYIAKNIIELHQGRIWVESEGRNKGSTFYIELPIK